MDKSENNNKNVYPDIQSGWSTALLFPTIDVVEPDVVLRGFDRPIGDVTENGFRCVSCVRYVDVS